MCYLIGDNMIKGTYIFYEDGKEICRSQNVITLFGKRFLTNFIAGNNITPDRDLAFGIDRKEVLVTAASASAGTVTYTGRNYFTAGDVVSIYGLSTSAFNLSNANIASASTTQFTVTNSATGTAVSASASGRAFKKASELDTRLGFEFYRLPVSLSSTDIQTAGSSSSYSVVYKTTIPQEISGVISEIGLYPSTRSSANNYDSKFITDFSDALDWTDNGGFTTVSSTANARIGDSLLDMESDDTSVNEYTSNIYFDIAGYSQNDTLSLAYYKYDENIDNIRVKFYSTDTAWFYVDITPQAGLGYKISPDISVGTLFNQSGGSTTVDPSQISKVGIEITPTSGDTTKVGMDALRINDEDTFDPIFGIISRTTLATPLEKIAGRSVDVEYRLDLGF